MSQRLSIISKEKSNSFKDQSKIDLYLLVSNAYFNSDNSVAMRN